MRLVLLSPIPPVRSGTADYFKTFLENVLLVFEAREVHVVVNYDDYQNIPTTSLGVKVSDYRTFVFEKEDIAIYFTSNNHFHHYVYGLMRSNVPTKKIAVIHDVQCAMSALDMMLKEKNGFSTANFEDFFGSEFKIDKAGRFDYVKLVRMPHLMLYLACGQDFVIEHCDELWTHSYYGFSKLAFEASALEKGAKIHVIQMAREYEKPKSLKKPKKFTVGIFGFVAPHKRVTSVIEGFSKFLNMISERDREQVELIIVGENSRPDLYDPNSFIIKFGLEKYAKDYGFVSLEEMEKLIEISSVIFNLRFPSCGETSATMRRAQDLGVKVVGSRYQAFAEEDMDDFCSIERNMEILDIVRILNKYFREFKEEQRELLSIKKNHFAEKISVQTILANLKEDIAR